MSKIKKPYKSITSTLLTSRFITIAVLISTTVICSFAAMSTNKMHKQSIENAYAVAPNGEVMPLKLVNRADNLEIEIMNHIDMFHRHFYNLNNNNYKESIDKALWLADASVDEVYRQKLSEGVYNKLVQFNLIQRVNSIDTKLSLTNNVINFKTVTKFQIERGEVVDYFEVTTKGSIDSEMKRNFPRNPHGLLIKNFFEQSFKKIITDE